MTDIYEMFLEDKNLVEFSNGMRSNSLRGSLRAGGHFWHRILKIAVRPLSQCSLTVV